MNHVRDGQQHLYEILYRHPHGAHIGRYAHPMVQFTLVLYAASTSVPIQEVPLGLGLRLSPLETTMLYTISRHLFQRSYHSSRE